MSLSSASVADNIVPLVIELRPITLLNVDYKILTKIFVKRLMRVMSSLIRSCQSCSVNGSIICTAGINLVSLIEGVARSCGQAAIISLDLYQAYDRVNLQ